MKKYLCLLIIILFSCNNNDENRIAIVIHGGAGIILKENISKSKEDSIINKLEITNSLIILDKNSKEKIEKSVRNIPNVKVTDVNHFSAYDIIKFKKVVFTESSVKELEKRYS